MSNQQEDIWSTIQVAIHIKTLPLADVAELVNKMVSELWTFGRTVSTWISFKTSEMFHLENSPFVLDFPILSNREVIYSFLASSPIGYTSIIIFGFSVVIFLI